MNKTEQALLVKNVATRTKAILVEIHRRGGFIPANIELIEDAIAEINKVLSSDEIIQNQILWEAFAPMAESYKKLKLHYENFVRGNNE